MHDITDFLRVAAGVILTVALIAIGVRIYNGVLEADARRAERDRIKLAEMEYATVMKYDGKSIHGGAITSYIKEIEDEVQTIFVKTPKTPAGFYVKEDGSEKAGTKELGDYDSAYYIAPMAIYKVDVTLNANGVPESVNIIYKPTS